MKISILTNKEGWFIPFGNILKERIETLGHTVKLINSHKEIEEGDICFILSYGLILNKNVLKKNSNNIVIHASDLPKGKGFSPIKWQILEGKNDIILTLFEAEEVVDSGPYYFKEVVRFKGDELYVEIARVIGEKIIEMALSFMINKNYLKAIQQSGDETFYRKRSKYDDEIDPFKTIVEIFNSLRIADNQRHKAWFTLYGRKFSIMIDKCEE